MDFICRTLVIIFPKTNLHIVSYYKFLDACNGCFVVRVHKDRQDSKLGQTVFHICYNLRTLWTKTRPNLAGSNDFDIEKES